MVDRPLLITIMAIVIFISGILALLAGLALTVLSGILSLAILEEGSIPTPGVPIAFLSAISALGTVVGLVIIILAIILLLVGRGFWIGSGWARFLALILFAFSAITDIYNVYAAEVALASVAVGLVIALFFLYYLTRPHVVAFFS